ncbi:MAG: FtsQ-type POTRA domain-containing protein [Candidatus Eremiobacterota bacterium]
MTDNNRRKFRIIDGGKVSSHKKEDTFRIFLIIIILCINQFIFCSSDFFLIREIAVTGSKYIPVEKIVENSQVVKQNIWYIIFDRGSAGSSQVARRLKDIPWISNISLQFELPDRIIINIKERQPIAILKTADSSFYIDEEGIIVSTVDTLNNWNFPVIRGLDKDIFLGKKLIVNNLDTLILCLKSCDPDIIENFPEVEVDEKGDIILYSRNNIKFNLGGDKKEIPEKLSLLPSISQSISDKGLAIESVDMRYKRFVLKLHGTTKKNDKEISVVHKED